MAEGAKKKWGFKKTTYTYSKWGRYDPRGKGSKEKSEMIQEMNRIIHVLSKRIDKIKATFTWRRQLWEEEKKELIKKAREDKQEALKELRRQKNREKSEERQSLGVKSLRDKLATRDARLASLAEEKEKVLKELRLAKRREERLRKRLDASLAQLKRKLEKRVVEKEVIPDGIKPLITYLEKPLNKRLRNVQEALMLILVFIREENISPNHLNFLLQVADKGNSPLSGLKGVLTEHAKACEDKGWVNSVYTNARKIYYLTADGEKITKKLIDKVSYGRI